MQHSSSSVVTICTLLVCCGDVLCATPRLLVLESSSPESMAPTAFEEVMRPALEERLGGKVDARTEYLALNRFLWEGHEQELAKELRSRYRQSGIDLIVAVGFPALDFVRREGEEILPGIPVVFVAVDAHRLQGIALPPNTTGVTHENDWSGALDEILRIHPATQEVVVVYGSSSTDHEYLEERKKLFRPFESRVKFRYLTDLPLLDLLAMVSRLPADRVVIQGSFTADSRGQTLTDDGALKLIYAAANVPVYALVGRNLGEGFVGGPMAAYRERYLAAADIASRILRGEKPVTIPVQTVVSEHAMAFDWRQLQRWKISEDRLPPGSLIAFREPPTWHQYRWVIAGAALLFLLEGALIFGLLVQGSRRRRVENDLRQSRNRVRDLAGRLIIAQEEERKRIARDLHDDLSQQLAALGILVSAIKRDLDGSIPAARRRLEDLQRRLRGAGDGVRELSHQLHPAVLEYSGLDAALGKYVEDFSRRTGISIAFENRVDPSVPVPSELALCLYRVAQEGLRNVEKYSGTHEASMSLDQHGGAFELIIEDRGIGFELVRAGQASGLGLTSMKERVRLLQGDLLVESTPGEGTRVCARVPCEPAQARAKSIPGSGVWRAR